MNRKSFIKQTGTTAAGLLLLPSLLRKVAPSDKLRMAHIGLGGMGNNHMNWFAALPEVDIVALCDVDQDHLHSTFARLKTLQPDTKADIYTDFRRVLERKDIDAISCATPDHWHAQVASLAFQAGKDVYGEKPLSYDIKEGQVMLKNLKRHDRIFQLGTQIHAGDNYHRVVEIIRSGAIGNVHTVRIWKTGFPPVLQGEPQTPPPALDWDMWLGPAPYHDYIPSRCHFSYRYFLDYSGGVFADFWCHISDIVFWSLDPKGLKTIDARGEAPTEGIGDAPKWIDVDYEFENLKLYWTHEPPAVPGAADRGIGAWFEGDKGTLLCDYETKEITINGQKLSDVADVPSSIPRSPGHQQNFVDAVKSRKQPESNLDYARKLTLPMHLGMISYRLKRKLEWNSAKEKFVHDREANSYLHREYRKKWDLL